MIGPPIAARRILTGAQLLRARGVQPGERVMIVAENCVAELVLYFAASELGACQPSSMRA